MKTILTAIILLVSVAAMADIPRPGQKPKPVVDSTAVDAEAEAAEVLLFGAPSAKITALKAGGNTLKVSVTRLSAGVDKFTYSTKHCSLTIAGTRCLGGKVMSITRTVERGPDHKIVKYKASEVLSVK